MDGVETIRDTPFGECIRKTILDITTGDLETEHWDKVYFHLSDGTTFFATIGSEERPGLMGMIDMEADDDDEEESEA
jgi:hypothetical protein